MIIKLTIVYLQNQMLEITLQKVLFNIIICCAKSFFWFISNFSSL